MKGLFTLVAACIAGLSAQLVDAQVPIGQVQNFTGAAPPLTSFSSKSVAGAGGSIALAADMDTAVQTNTAASINSPLTPSTAAAPGQTAQAIWTSGAGSGGLLVTRPTGNSYTILMGTFTNTGVALSSVVISYAFGMPSALAGEDAELAGHRVYYSTTGAESSWTLIPELTSATPTPVAGNLLHTLTVSIPVNGLLYLIWVDDNGGPGTDGSFSIDNVLVSTAIACPNITTQPANTTNVQNRTVSLSVVATGPGLTYQWSKVGVGALADGPTGSGSIIAGATAASLVISNAQTTDTGDYFVVISNPCTGGPVTSGTAHLQINLDTEPPRFVSARGVSADPLSFTVTMDEPLCQSESCGYQADVYPFVWTVEDAVTGEKSMGDPTAAVISADGMSVTVTLQFPRTAGTLYKIIVDNTGPGFQVTDLAGNAMAAGTFIITTPTASFMQNVDGYTGVEDTELEQGTEFGGPDVIHGTAPRILVDQANQGGVSHGLLKFNNIFGNAPGQIPLGSTIISATLTLQHTAANANGDLVNVYRMVAPWSQSSATYNSFVDGITNDNIECRSTPDFTIVSSTLTVPFTLNLDVTVSVQAWSNGEANQGWGMIPTGGDGYRFDASAIATGPQLTVEYRVNPCTTMPSIVTQPPASTTVNEGAPVSIAVGVNACGATTYQWKKGGVNVPGQNGQNLTIASAVPSDAGSYTLEVTNPNGTATSAAATLIVNADTTQPTVVSVTGGSAATPTTVTIVFSKVVSAATAQNTANYRIGPTLAVNSAVLSADGRTVTLTTAARTEGTHYSIRISGIRDTRASQNLLNPNPTIASLGYQIVTPLLAFTDVWKYEQSGTDLGTDWRASGYNDSAWPSGPGVLGFETTSNTLFFLRTIAPPGGTNTVLSLTNSAGQTNPTIYFRTTFNNPYTPAFGVTYSMRAYVDDGAVWYVNGIESGRYNINTTPTLFNTTANGALAEPNPNPQTTFITRSLTGVVPGLNHLAVEVHQDALTSSDLDWGAEIVAIIEGPTLQVVHSGANVTISWVGAGTLQEAAAVTGPWSNSATQTNPQTRPAGGTMRYFRLLVLP